MNLSKACPENGSASKRNETKFLSIRLRSKNWIRLHLSTWQVKGGPVSGPIPELLWETSGKHGKLLTQLKQSNPAYTHFWFYVFQEFCRLYRLLHFTSEAWRPYPPCRLYSFAIFRVKNAVSVPPEAEIATFEDRPHVRLLAGQIPVQGIGAHRCRGTGMRFVLWDHSFRYRCPQIRCFLLHMIERSRP